MRAQLALLLVIGERPHVRALVERVGQLEDACQDVDRSFVRGLVRLLPVGDRPVLGGQPECVRELIVRDERSQRLVVADRAAARSSAWVWATASGRPTDVSTVRVTESVSVTVSVSLRVTVVVEPPHPAAKSTARSSAARTCGATPIRAAAAASSRPGAGTGAASAPPAASCPARLRLGGRLLRLDEHGVGRLACEQPLELVLVDRLALDEQLGDLVQLVHVLLEHLDREAVRLLDHPADLVVDLGDLSE